MTIKAFTSENILAVIIKIPLSDSLEYSLYQTFPLPTPRINSNIISYISTDYPYIIASKGNAQFALLKNLKNSKFVNQYYICTQINTLEKCNSHICELQLFTDEEEKMPKTCKTTNIHATPEIWQPINKNQWLFILTKETKGILNCSNKNEIQKTFNGIGIFKIDQNCTLTTKHITLITERIMETNPQSIRIPQIDIIQDECCRFVDELNPKVLNPIKITSLNPEELQLTQHRIK